MSTKLPHDAHPEAHPDSHPDAHPDAHPDDHVLADFVIGDVHLCRRVLIEAHLSFCAQCRARVEKLSRPASAFVASMPEIAPPDALWANLAARLEGEQGASPADVLAETPLPAGARGELPLRSTPLDWLPQGDGEISLIAGDQQEELALFLVRTPPELYFPYHVHLGGEEIVILTGGYTDEHGHLGTGDFRAYEAGSAHGPRMDPGEVCWAVALIIGGVEMRQPPG